MIMNADYHWYALYVKSRHEFVTQSELSRKEITTFLPSVKRIRQWKDRKKFIHFPLFPGYLFVYIMAKPDDYTNVLKAQGAVHLLSTESGCPTPVSPEEINSLKIMIESGQPIDIYPNLKKGAAVRVKRGPLAGAEGTISNKSDQYIFVVNIDMLGRSIGVTISADDIEPA
jgi:transcription termination/antitermination protein NusG